MLRGADAADPPPAPPDRRRDVPRPMTMGGWEEEESSSVGGQQRRVARGGDDGSPPAEGEAGLSVASGGIPRSSSRLLGEEAAVEGAVAVAMVACGVAAYLWPIV
jgi:hypothetical protein